MRVSSRAAKEATLKEVRLEVANKPWLWSLLPEWLKLFTSSPEYQPQASNPFLGSRLASGGPQSLQKVSRRRKARIPAGAPVAMVPVPVPAPAAMVPAPVPAPAAMVPTPVAVPAAMVPCSSAGPHSQYTVLQYHPTQPWFRVPVPCPAAMVPAPEPAHTAMVPAPQTTVVSPFAWYSGMFQGCRLSPCSDSVYMQTVTVSRTETQITERSQLIIEDGGPAERRSIISREEDPAGHRCR
ncbi:hypothetical protein F7725_025676 [Dissostichus mawsoni]|uniref:Uncharacterized protein n=1 Tax=Dissostichus mawsoni TaxID=36200 RepID=A0A7J5XBS2_DISMA|nr:hypothetical protein F7725_025676 [Dissostichus mawsoni]